MNLVSISGRIGRADNWPVKPLNPQLWEELDNIREHQPVPHGHEVSKQSRRELERMGLAFYYQDDDLKIPKQKKGLGGTVLSEKGKKLIEEYESALTSAKSRVVFFEDQEKARGMILGYHFDEDSGYWFNSDHTDMKSQLPENDKWLLGGY